ncbi:UNVERIFIED_CONTAM: hypothetical protein RF648_18930 [Kocuria sp. CPCC 205274]|uniref:Uncharacterized protein n=1 Tax=Herbiconiux daphne TaxID=2970914 RepID=A0ABT2H948_9MICO|nr:hypothetical protein [Herbiconiux daphne]MCS5736436.1 hypothetical protein [Herbiconiux daphne]
MTTLVANVVRDALRNECVESHTTCVIEFGEGKKFFIEFPRFVLSMIGINGAVCEAVTKTLFDVCRTQLEEGDETEWQKNYTKFSAFPTIGRSSIGSILYDSSFNRPLGEATIASRFALYLAQLGAGRLEYGTDVKLVKVFTSNGDDEVLVGYSAVVHRRHVIKTFVPELRALLEEKTGSNWEREYTTAADTSKQMVDGNRGESRITAMNAAWRNLRSQS